jgi:hypothetical protein
MHQESPQRTIGARVGGFIIDYSEIVNWIVLMALVALCFLLLAVVERIRVRARRREYMRRFWTGRRRRGWR